MDLSLSSIRDSYVSLEAPSGVLRKAWDRLHRVPGGKRLFSKMIGRGAPYTGTIDAVVQDLRDGHAEVRLQDRKQVRNHLQCVHAIALTNLAELAANVAFAYGLPDDARFIVAGLSIDYVKKARGSITATCEAPAVSSNQRREYTLPVVMRNDDNEIVATCSVRTLVGPARNAED